MPYLHEINLETIRGFFGNLTAAHEALQEAGRIMHSLCCRENEKVDEEVRMALLELMNKKIPDAVRRCVYYFAVAYQKRENSQTDVLNPSSSDDPFESFDFFPDWMPTPLVCQNN